mmetsp:Transcript_44898/g.73141  ORF Transcript_44898/g.73141 Transcript_44898/m.73141 type:complete len:112 (-) Transcript_44898:663-998(-)
MGGAVIVIWGSHELKHLSQSLYLKYAASIVSSDMCTKQLQDFAGASRQELELTSILPFYCQAAPSVWNSSQFPSNLRTNLAYLIYMTNFFNNAVGAHKHVTLCNLLIWLPR